jgi:hypothetical protein
VSTLVCRSGGPGLTLVYSERADKLVFAPLFDIRSQLIVTHVGSVLAIAGAITVGPSNLRIIVLFLSV